MSSIPLVTNETRWLWLVQSFTKSQSMDDRIQLQSLLKSPPKGKEIDAVVVDLTEALQSACSDLSVIHEKVKKILSGMQLQSPDNKHGPSPIFFQKKGDKKNCDD